MNRKPVYRVAIRRPLAQDEPAMGLELDNGSPPLLGLREGGHFRNPTTF